MVQQQPLDLLIQQIRFGQVADPDRAPRHLVLIGRADAATGRADARGTTRLLARAVDPAVQRQDQRRVVGDPQAIRPDRDALAAQLVDLGE